MSTNSRDVLTVSQLNRLARQLLEDCFPSVAVTGELSNLARPSSGHWYFTLKDDQAQVRCAMFRSRNQRLRFEPQPGQQLQARGKVSLYEGRGDYQLIVESLQPAGEGALAMAFEQLKRELAEAGYFDPAHKQPLPETVRHIGVVTSPSGAAIRDVLSVLERRWPAMEITLFPVMVQGEEAASQICRAIQQANRLVAEGRLELDVLLLSRGGGSLEDLWPFNERTVAQAVFDSDLPVVCAVGHEIDVSIADFVADARAATPSAAAELLSPDQREVAAALAAQQNRLRALALRRLSDHRQRLLALVKRMRHPGQRLREQSQRLDERELRLRRAVQRLHSGLRQRVQALTRQLDAYNPARQLRQQKIRLRHSEQRLVNAARAELWRRRQRLDNLTQLLRNLSPENTLQRGFAVVTDAGGRLVTDSAGLSPGDHVSTRLARGGFDAAVSKTRSPGGDDD